MANPAIYNTGLTKEQISDMFLRAANSVQSKTGKGLSTNDYTDSEKSAVASIQNKINADNTYTKSEINAMLSNKADYSTLSGNIDSLQEQITALSARVTALEGNK